MLNGRSCERCHAWLAGIQSHYVNSSTEGAEHGVLAATGHAAAVPGPGVGLIIWEEIHASMCCAMLTCKPYRQHHVNSCVGFIQLTLYASPVAIAGYCQHAYSL